MKLWETFLGNVKTFGFKIKEPVNRQSLESIDVQNIDGATEVVADHGGVISHYTDISSLPTSEVELIRTYRELAVTSDVDWALNEIRNEVFIFDVPGKKAVDISFSDTEDNNISDKLIESIRKEYNYLYNLLDFQHKGLELFDRWYIDGRLFLQKVIDNKNIRSGIQKIVRIDPIKIRRIVEYPAPDKDGIFDLSDVKLFYLFSDVYDVYHSKTSMLKVITNDAISYADSGIYDFNTGIALSNLWKLIVPYNNMKMMEEALLVYRVVRSPERRVMYIGVGNLSKPKAEQYMKDLMSKFRNKLVYDSSSGKIVDRKNVLSMVEDYWIPRRENDRTEIQTLAGAQNLGTIDDVELFKSKFQQSTNIPISRFREESGSFTFGRTSEINRDEYRFKKFLDKLRNRFVTIFEDLLKTQLVLKKVIVDSDWDDIKQSLIWIFAEDNNFVQWKESEVLQNQIESLSSMDAFVGRYFSKEWALKKSMNLSDEEVKEMITRAEKGTPQDDGDIAEQFSQINEDANGDGETQ